MRLRIVSAALAALGLLTVSCSENEITAPQSKLSVSTDIVATVLPEVRVSEFHYDNSGTDTNESIEISGPAGTDLTGWKLVLYNGDAASRIPYGTTSLTQTIPTTCGDRGVVVITYGLNGIQNGSPDGFALVDNTGAVVEFLSYEGSFVAAGTSPTSPAAGMTSTDIGVAEAGNEPVDPTTGVQSLKRNGSGVWSGPSANNFGICNDIPPGSVASVTISPDGATIIEGGTQQFTAVAKDSVDATIPDATFSWSSLNEAVATVSATGVATAISAGTASIVATSGGKADTVTLQVDEPPPDVSGPSFISEIHYDNSGTDTNERIEIEGPAGTNVSGWSLVLYNGNGGVTYSTIALTGVIPSLCDGRGVLTFAAPGLQNGSTTATGIDPDGIALVKTGNVVADFISYEGSLTATNGPAVGQTSTDIGVRETGSRSDAYSLMRYADDWYGPQPNTFDACNPPPPPPSISFSGRLPGDVALPVGFQDQLFATLTDASGNDLDTAFVWTSETPGVASIDQDGVFTAITAGSATFRATIKNGTITNTWSLPTTIATASGSAMYAGNTEFGIPADSDASDDFIITHPEYTSSFNKNRGTPNWVSYDLEETHFGAQDRCDCFTFDPAAAGIATPYTTNAYTGSAAINGFGIDRGHLARSFDRTSGSLDNAFTFYFSNIVPQASDLNQGPWANMENFLGDLARFQNKEVYIIAGVAGENGTLKNEGKVVIPDYTWKVALVLPRDQGLANVDSYDDVQVYAAVMPNVAGVRNVDWHTYLTTVDSVEALSGYDLLALLPDPVEIAVESSTVPPVAAVDGPYSGYLPGESISMSGAASSDADGQPLDYAWNFGDGATGTGSSVTHAYAAAGTYTVQLIVTDPLTLSDTVTTTATVMTQAQAAALAKAIVDELLTNGKIDAPTANSLSKKLDAAIASFERGGPAVNQLNSLLNQIDDLVNTGVLQPADAAPLITLINRIIASV
ncbi:MAG TPA: DNA/RNA non-specific endonuclease [Gemmatimonadaceae bacterium]|nr:DNA/RNA non-specific endonuclease [Gemmatimonadaceae bacterium]